MANEEVLGPRKTMFVLVIVVGCFAVLWPRILSPLIVGHTREQLKPNQFDREAGCCEVMFETELAVLELLNEVCSSAVQADGKLSPYAAAECRKAVNETCGVDIAAFLKRTENVGKSSKMLVATMKSSNSSCLREHFGVPVWSLGPHPALRTWIQDSVKQERSPIRGAGPHPALRERGRAIPAGSQPAPPRPTPLPPHIRPPPIPGMRPPLGSPGGPVPAPKSSMGFVMPIYTICIIVFFVYTLSKILFKRTGSPYDQISPDPQFRSRVFRDDSRTSPDKLVVTAISGLVAEVQQQMEASYAHDQRRQEAQDNNTRPYTNGTILHNSGPVHIVTSEYREEPKEKSPEPEKEKPAPEQKEPTPEPKETIAVTESNTEDTQDIGETVQETKEKESSEETTPEPKESTPESNVTSKEEAREEEADNVQTETKEVKANHKESELLKPASDVKKNGDVLMKLTEEFLKEECNVEMDNKSTQQLLEEAIEEDLKSEEPEEDNENASVKVVGMELSAHSADGAACAPPAPALPAAAPPRAHVAPEVQSIYLSTQIPHKSRVLVADCAPPAAHSPTVVSGKMTLSLIQDAAESPERDPESTVDDFTTASALTQNAAEKEDDLSEEEIEEEIEIEEIEEEVEEIEEEEEEEDEVEHKDKAKKATGTE